MHVIYKLNYLTILNNALGKVPPSLTKEGDIFEGVGDKNGVWFFVGYSGKELDFPNNVLLDQNNVLLRAVIYTCIQIIFETVAIETM